MVSESGPHRALELFRRLTPSGCPVLRMAYAFMVDVVIVCSFPEEVS
jgi:hypothetical protein